MQGDGAMLRIDQPTQFHAGITGFGGSDTIDMKGYNVADAIVYHEAANGQGGTLVVTDGDNRFATHLTGTYAAEGFSLTASADGAALHYGGGAPKV